jgi:deoxyribonuclease IV
MYIGFHLPIGKGLEHTYREAKRLRCEVVQIFVKNPRSWAQKAWTDKDREVFGRLFVDLPVVAHLSYLPNIARSDEEPKNLKGLLHEAGLCVELGIDRMVVHCGSREATRKGIDVAARSVKEVLQNCPVTVLLENSAGQGNVIGRSIEELAQIFETVGDADRVGFCLDTAHLFESGYDVREPAVWAVIIDRLEKRCGPDSIRFLHLNDSKTPLGSTTDRHWHIGEGQIGVGFFRYLINEKRLAHLGGVMETPKMGNMDEENMETMRSLLSPLVSGPFS